MSENTEDLMVVIDDNEVSFSDLAGIDLSEVKAVRFSVTPAGKFHWRIKEISLENKTVPLDYDDPASDDIKIACMSVTLVAVNCLALVDDELEPEDFIDANQFMNFNIKEAKKDLGKVVAFFEDIGIEVHVKGKSIQDLMDEAHGVEFVSDIVHAKNRNNPDIIFANVRNIETMEDYHERMSSF